MSMLDLLDRAKFNESNEIVLPPNDSDARRIFFNEFLKTESGREVEPYLTEAAEERIGEVAAKWFGADAELTIPQLERVVASLVAVRDPALFPPEPATPAPVADARPRDPNTGRYLSEHEIWATDPKRSMVEIRARAQRDPAFREFFQSNAIAQTVQEGAFKIVGLPTRTATDADRQALSGFIAAYKAAPADRLKPRAGRITLDSTHSYTPDQFESLVSRASQAGLL